MLTTDLILVLLVGLACGGALWLFMNMLWHVLHPWLRGYCTKLLQRLPPKLFRILEKAAFKDGATEEPVDYLFSRVAMWLSLVFCLILPLPNAVTWLVAGVIVVNFIHRRGQRHAYLRSFTQQWPNCLDMLAMLMRSGLSFSAALHGLAQQPSDSVAMRQLRQLQQQLNAGIALEVALASLRLKVPTSGTSAFSAAVLQARSSGSALADTLMQQAEQARSEQQLAAEKFAQEVGVKLLLPLVTCFFPVTFLLILGPIFIGFLET